jgi:hypothetical protein
MEGVGSSRPSFITVRSSKIPPNFKFSFLLLIEGFYQVESVVSHERTPQSLTYTMCEKAAQQDPSSHQKYETE